MCYRTRVNTVQDCFCTGRFATIAARVIQHLGIGTAYAPGAPTVDSLTDALREAMTPDVATRARSIAPQVSGDGARTAAQRVAAMMAGPVSLSRSGE